MCLIKCNEDVWKVVNSRVGPWASTEASYERFQCQLRIQMSRFICIRTL